MNEILNGMKVSVTMMVGHVVKAEPWFLMTPVSRTLRFLMAPSAEP